MAHPRHIPPKETILSSHIQNCNRLCRKDDVVSFVLGVSPGGVQRKFIDRTAILSGSHATFTTNNDNSSNTVKRSYMHDCVRKTAGQIIRKKDEDQPILLLLRSRFRLFALLFLLFLCFCVIILHRCVFIGSFLFPLFPFLVVRRRGYLSLCFF